jgi:hypothetical protein
VERSEAPDLAAETQHQQRARQPSREAALRSPPLFGSAARLKDVMEESLAAVASGIDRHGICLFSAIDMLDWHTGQRLHHGICDLVADGTDLRRVPDPACVEELGRWQRELNRVTVLDQDPFSDSANCRTSSTQPSVCRRFRTKTEAEPEALRGLFGRRAFVTELATERTAQLGSYRGSGIFARRSLLLPSSSSSRRRDARGQRTEI